MGYWASCKELRLVSSYFKPLTHYHLDQYSKFFYLLKSISINYIKSGYAATVLCTVHFGFMSFFFFVHLWRAELYYLPSTALSLSYHCFIILLLFGLIIALFGLVIALLCCYTNKTNFTIFSYNYWHARMR